MQVVTERFVLYNFWTLADRATFLVAAVFVRLCPADHRPHRGRLIKWSVITALKASLELAAITVPMVVLMVKDPPSVRPNPLPSNAGREP